MTTLQPTIEELIRETRQHLLATSRVIRALQRRLRCEPYPGPGEPVFLIGPEGVVATAYRPGPGQTENTQVDTEV